MTGMADTASSDTGQGNPESNGSKSNGSASTGPAGTGAGTIEFAEIQQRMTDPLLNLIDVLPEQSWRAEHLPGARNLPYATLTERAPRELPDREAEIAVYCAGPT